jgi:Gpi18-like mannosyltransferase
LKVNQSLLPKAVWVSYLIHTVVILVAFFVADYMPPHDPNGFVNPSVINVDPSVAKWIKWDAHWYTYIAEHGYDSQNIVFFPVTVILIKSVAMLGLGYALGGIVICNLFAFASFCVLYSTFQLDFSEKEAERALLAYAVLPTSFFINSIYTEPIFIALSVACVYFTRVGNWWYAGAFAALATLTRNIGSILFLFMVYEFWICYKKEQKLTYSSIALVSAPVALLVFMLYNFWLLGDPLAFVHSQRQWGRAFAWPWISIWNNGLLLVSSMPHIPLGVILDFFMVLGTFSGLLFLTFSSKFKVRPSYLIVGWLWFAIPLFSTSLWFPLYSMSRFVLVIFPLYLFLAQLPKGYYYLYLLLSTLLLLLCTAAFMNWYWIG